MSRPSKYHQACCTWRVSEVLCFPGTGNCCQLSCQTCTILSPPAAHVQVDKVAVSKKPTTCGTKINKHTPLFHWVDLGQDSAQKNACSLCMHYFTKPELRWVNKQQGSETAACFSASGMAWLYFITELNENFHMTQNWTTNKLTCFDGYHGYIATLSSPTHVYMTSASASFEFLFFADQDRSPEHCQHSWLVEQGAAGFWRQSSLVAEVDFLLLRRSVPRSLDALRHTWLSGWCLS